MTHDETRNPKCRSLLLACALALAACSGEDDPPDLEGACAAQRKLETAGDFDAFACEELHAEAPYVRLPDAGSGRVFGQIVQGDFQDASGKSYGFEGGREFEDREGERHGTALYLADVDGSSVSNLRPLLLLDEKHFHRALAGRSFEGRVSSKASAGGGPFAFEASLPVKVDFAEEFTEERESGRLALSGRIANLTQSVSGADGSCLPALSSHAGEAPFGEEASVELHGFRVPAMHLFNDDVFVMEWLVDGGTLGTVMGVSWYVTPFDVVNGTQSPDASYAGYGHGTPGITPTIELDPEARGDGEPCGD